MTRFLSRMTVLAISGFGVSSIWAADVSFSGFFDGDVAGYYNTDTKVMDFQANHELDLTATVKVNDKVSVDLYGTSYTAHPVTGGTVPAQGNAAGARWTGFDYDGFVASVKASEALGFKFGDLSYSSGQFNYYGYKRTNTYAVGLKDRGFRGLQADYMGLTLATGADKLNEYGAYAAYNLDIAGSTVKPFFSMTSDQVTDSTSMRSGFDATVVMGDHKIKIAAAAYKDKGDEVSSTLAFEPILAFGSATVAATFFMAVLDDTDPTAVNVPEKMFFYVEPGFALNDVVSVGLPLEYHTMTLDKDASLEEAWVVPTAYFALGEGFNWSVWAQGSARLGDDALSDDPYFGIGSEAILTF